MRRGAVLIGVDKTGNAPVLNDAANGAKRMADWANRQRIDEIALITDAGGQPVVVSAVFNAIKRIADKGVDQLVVYFAGHGVNVGQSERWLLTDAPGDPNAAVNVSGSAETAHFCSIGHVVLFSDACRTAADGLQAQSVTGSIIFENKAAVAVERPVDRFYATRLGDPAHEIKDPNTAAGQYRALYTDALFDALCGELADVIEDEPPYRVVRPRPLRDVLHEELKRRIKARKLAGQIIQEPAARITSDDNAWVSRLPGLRDAVAGTPGGAPPGGHRKDFIIPVPTGSLQFITRTLLRSAVTGGPLFDEALQRARADDQLPSVKAIAERIDRSRAPRGPDHFETECGFKVQGARVDRAFTKFAKAEVIQGELIRMSNVPPWGASVLIVFDSGAGTVLPAIPGFIGDVTVEDGGLTNVSYEPSSQTFRWQDFKQRAHTIRALRAIAGSATRSGVFELEEDDALKIATEMQYAKGLDPTLAVYAAYAYRDLRRRDRIKEMSNFLRSDVGVRMFDIAMLAGELRGPVKGGTVLPYFPLLSQGWSLLAAYDVRLPRGLEKLQGMLMPSVWTLFSARAVNHLYDVTQSDEVDS